MNSEQNPYASPSFTDDYKPDWSAFRRILTGFAVLAAIIFVVDSIAWGAFLSGPHWNESWTTQLQSFFGDWMPSR
jgi:hypothetical protein